MSYKRRLIATVLFFVLALNAGITAFASETPDDDGVKPIFTGVVFVTANITVSETGLANVTSNIMVLPDYRIDGTIELRRDNNHVVGSWSISGTLDLSYSKTKYVTSGHDYSTLVSFDVYDSNDKVVDHIEVSSKAYSY